MAEWAILLVLVPAIVIPVVLLFGFAGCFSKPHFEPRPLILSAVGSSLTSIALDWSAAGSVRFVRFEIRAQPGNTPLPNLEPVTSSPVEVPGLAPGTYRFRAQTEFQDGDESDWTPPVDASTLTTTFDTSADPGVPGDQPAQGFCIVQRLEPVRLSTSGGRVRIILRGPAAGSASIDRVYISRPAGPGDPYDAAADLTAVFDINNPNTPAPIVVQPNLEVPLPGVDYNLDESQPLLIAFDFTPSFPTIIRFQPVTQDAIAYFQPGVAEAGIPGGNRTAGYAQANGICLITRIEVG